MMAEENTDNTNPGGDGTALTGDPSQNQNPNQGSDPAAGSDPATGADPEAGQNPAEGQQSDADEGGAAGAPEAYADFTMPEGMDVDTALLEQAVPVFKELGLTQEQAQKLVDLQAQNVQASQQAQVDSFNQLKQDWLDQAKSDDEIGGDGFDENVSDARLFIDKFGTPELKTLLNDYGVGNHPEVIRAFARAGKLLKEDVPGGNGQPESGKKDRAEILYGK